MSDVTGTTKKSFSKTTFLKTQGFNQPLTETQRLVGRRAKVTGGPG